MSGVLVEPMISGGVETIVGVVQEPVFGPVVVFGLGGSATDPLRDHVARLAPLTRTDADDLVHSARIARALLGHDGQHAADVGALSEVLLRVSQLADGLPQVAELELNPVIARPDGAVAVDARVRVTGNRLADPFLRRFPHDNVAWLAKSSSLSCLTKLCAKDRSNQFRAADSALRPAGRGGGVSRRAAG